jgi:hypothetical protein
VGAARRALPPGSSFRTHSEQLALAERVAVTERPAGPFDGVALVRDGVDARAESTGIVVDGGWITVDLGAMVHDPSRVDPTPGPASPLGRPPFPWRPVAVLVLTEADDAAAAWARTMANVLLFEGIEARIAATAPIPGEHLSHPCTASPASLRILRPDVVVALDDGAVAAADWAGSRRTTVVRIDAADEPGEPTLVPWRIGEAQGRVRARASRAVGAAALAGTIRRLAAGPHPVAPITVDRPVPAAAPVPVPAPVPAAQRTVVLALGTAEAGGRARIEALAADLRRRGDRPQLTSPDATDLDPESELLVLHAVRPSDALCGLLDERRTAGRPSVFDLGAPDLVAGHDGRLRLTPDAAEIATRASLLTTASGRVHAELRLDGWPVQLLPTPWPPAPAAEQRTADQLTVGWHLGLQGGADARILAAAAQALGALLPAGAAVDVVGDATVLPEDALGLPGLRLAADRPAAQLPRWTLVLWTPDRWHSDVSDAVGPLVAAGLRRVPVVAVQADAAARRAGVPEAQLVRRAEEARAWQDVLGPLLADGHALEVARDATARGVGAVADDGRDRAARQLLRAAFTAVQPA